MFLCNLESTQNDVWISWLVFTWLFCILRKIPAYTSLQIYCAIVHAITNRLYVVVGGGMVQKENSTTPHCSGWRSGLQCWPHSPLHPNIAASAALPNLAVVAPDSIRQHQTALDSIRQHHTAPDSSRQNQTAPDSTKHHKTALSIIRQHQIVSDRTRQHQTASDSTKHHQTALSISFVGHAPYWIINKWLYLFISIIFLPWDGKFSDVALGHCLPARLPAPHCGPLEVTAELLLAPSPPILPQNIVNLNFQEYFDFVKCKMLLLKLWQIQTVLLFLLG